MVHCLDVGGQIGGLYGKTVFSNRCGGPFRQRNYTAIN